MLHTCLSHARTDPSFTAGLVVSVLDPHPGECIIDCCAAPGGKTLFIASLMSGQGNLQTTRSSS